MATKIETIKKRLEAIETQAAALSKKQEDLSAEYRKLSNDLVEAGASAERDAALANGLPQGTVVTFTYGRAETKRTLTGKVLASKASEQGRVYRIETGADFDIELFTVLASAIQSFEQAADVQPVSTNAAEENR